MATKTKTANKTVHSKRVRKLNRRNRKKVVKTSGAITNSFRLFGSSLKHIWTYKKTFGLILVLYFVLYFLLVKGLATNFELSESKELLEEALGDQLGTVGTASALFGILLGTAGTTAGEAGSVYQIVLFVFFSLVLIWTLRQTFEKQNGSVGLKNALYKSSYPVVPYILVFGVIILQCIPALIATTLYSLVQSNALAVGVLEQIVWAIVVIGGFALSVYFVSSSLFASYIVTLPDMTPLRALRSARKLVKYRRWSIIRKIVFLPLVLLLFSLIIFMPLVVYAPIVAELLFLILSIGFVIIMHTYFYMLYRELL